MVLLKAKSLLFLPIFIYTFFQILLKISKPRSLIAVRLQKFSTTTILLKTLETFKQVKFVK